MKALGNKFKYATIVSLMLASGWCSLPASAQEGLSGGHNNTVSTVLDANGQTAGSGTIANGYRPVGEVVPELSQIVFYYPEGKLPATVYVDRQLQSVLLPGEYTVFCVVPGGHAIESYFQDQPLYQGKRTPKHQLKTQGATTYFLVVNPGETGTTTALAKRSVAEADLQSMRLQSRIINRAKQVKACEYVKGGTAVLLQESLHFPTGKSQYGSILPASKAKLDHVITFLKEGNNVSDIQLIGYTDAIGNAAANQRLSQARANTVRDTLIRAGVNQNLITHTSGMGIAKDAEQCVANAKHQDSSCNAQGRRVDIVVK
ncbi:OmpA family protein [Serratia sp. DD3]|uniref:OmpA family protein n=1 Tax=Serratia sp. DD3 TaxID=1410619 RepID=UPI0004D432DB|nr:OmpA family protein [Serratia sp. DD3]KEY57389.1 photosystem I P700 chlorophyll a apoprotein A2 [Serratia sp. DD3]